MPLNHVALSVADRPRAAAFYGKFFGLNTIVYDDEHLLILGSADGSELALSDVDPVPVDLPRTSHFGFDVNDPAAVAQARDRFRAAGIAETE